MKITINKPKKVFLFILSILAVIIISSILAYLTDKEQKQNEFTIGSIGITLEETLWDALPDIDNSGIPDAAEAMGPGDTIVKDPKVVNDGQNDAYVYLRVTVPKANVKIENESTAKNQKIFEYTANTANWVLMPDLTIGENDLDENSVTYTYYYQNTLGTEDYLKAGAISETLFDEVTLKNIVDFNEMNLTQQIVVKAYAIQLGDELTVTSNPWITKFEEEKAEATFIPQMQGAKVLSSPKSEKRGYQPGESYTVGIPITGDVTVDEAPALTAQVEDGAEFPVPYDGVETASLEKNINLAVTSRAKKQVTTILKYTHIIQAGEVGEFKIKSFTGGKLYTSRGKKITIETVPTISEEEKVLIPEPAVKESIYDKLTTADYGKAIIEELPDYELFYVGAVRNDECSSSTASTNKIVLIYNGQNGEDGLKGYYPNNKIPSEASMTTIDYNGVQKTYSAWWKYSDLSGSGHENVRAIKKLNDASWTTAIVPEILDRSKVIAKGGVGLTTWVASWNANGNTKLYTKYKTGSYEGWCISKKSSVSNTSFEVFDLSNTNTLYFPYSKLKNDPTSSMICIGYWLASPSGCDYNTISLMSTGYDGSIIKTFYTGILNACRPVVYLTSDIQGVKNKTEKMWSLE